jgi:hypothetical protein
MADKSQNNSAPISLPKGGGAIKGIGEKFQPNLFSGTGDFSVPILTSPGRNGFGPKLTLQYSTGNGNGLFGSGWKLSRELSKPRITRKTEKGPPTYKDEDVFVMSGAEDLVPHLERVSTDSAQPERRRPAGGNLNMHRSTSARWKPGQKTWPACSGRSSIFKG